MVFEGLELELCGVSVAAKRSWGGRDDAYLLLLEGGPVLWVFDHEAFCSLWVWHVDGLGVRMEL